MDTRKRPWRERTVLLLTAVAVGVPLLELWTAPVLLAKTLPRRPVLGTLSFLLAGLGLALCCKGAQLESPRVRFLSRLLLLLFTLGVALPSIELLPISLATVAMHRGAYLEGNLQLIAALALVCMATAALKCALGLRVRYWILLIAAFGVLLVAAAALGWIFFGDALPALKPGV